MISSFDVAKQIFSDLKEIFNSKAQKLNGALPGINKASEPEEADLSDGTELIEEYSQKKEEVRCNKKPVFTEKNDEDDKMSGINLDLKEEKVLQAIVYAEIFGKPKAKTRRR